jgi:rhodanese-related sulfurtransferase
MSNGAPREKLARRVNWVVNVALALVGVALVVVLARSFFGGKGPTAVEPIQAGAKLNLKDVAWNENGQTLVMALSSECRYCTESAPFYQRLISGLTAGDKTRVVAVLPQSVSTGERYLRTLGVTPDRVMQANLGGIGFPQTPTLALVNAAGVVTETWVGKLNVSKQFAIFERLGVNNNELATDEVPTVIDTPTLKRAVEGKEPVTILDVGEREEYAWAHLPNAQNVPADEIEARALDELPAGNVIVVYCSNDALSERAAEILSEQGFRRISVLSNGAAQRESARLSGERDKTQKAR